MTNFKKASFILTVFITSLIVLLIPQKVVAQPLLDPSALSKGLKMIRKTSSNFITTGLPPLQYALQAYSEYLLDEKLDLHNKILLEQDKTAKKSLQVQKDQLEVQIKMADISKGQYELAKNGFEYNKQKDDSILRKLNYSFRPDKLVVVVADFSDGHNSQGIQVADEIYSNLIELKKKCGIDFEILNGEIKDKVVIRNEQMARDVGLHFPVGTCYAVIWGTISPRTVGMFRPNITFVLKNTEESGVANSFTIDMESKELPLHKDDEAQVREMYKVLVAFACASIPNCYASYEFACERVPNFEKLYRYLGESEEAKVEIGQLKNEILNLKRWPELRKTSNPIYPTEKPVTFEYLTRLTSVDNDSSYPKYVLNKKDGTVMVLITEKVGPSKPVIFKDEKFGNYICYIDTTEVTWGSFAYLYNTTSLREKVNLLNKGINFAPIGNFVNLGNDIKPRAGKFEFIKDQLTDQFEFAVTNISYSGAATYCGSAGKYLPRKEEWEKAKIGAKFVANALPSPKVKKHNLDVSEVGCFDMAGNVDEWADVPLTPDTKRTIFCSDNLRLADPLLMESNVGFRGVVRIPIGK